MTDRSLTNTPDADGREPTPEAGRLSALVALAQAGLEDQVRAGQLLTDGDVERLSNLVHREWVQREQSLPGGGRADRKSLHAVYVDLPEAQKGKDRAFVHEVVASLRPEGYWGGKGSPQPYRHPLGNRTVDMIVRRTGPNTGEVEVLLIRRGEEAVEGGEWALPGGFVDSDAGPGERWRPGKETDGEATRRELREESGLDVEALEDCVRHVGHFDRHGRDPRDNAEAWAVSDA
jgi:ADP-ribose pyrophosphatase YjhB (NUDIX family)